MRRFVISTLLLLTAVSTACGTTSGVTSAETTGGGSATYNAADPSACKHFHNIMVDINEGILTDSELRGKISEVRDDAVTEPVRKAATRLLAAVTSNSGVASAGLALKSACNL